MFSDRGVCLTIGVFSLVLIAAVHAVWLAGIAGFDGFRSFLLDINWIRSHPTHLGFEYYNVAKSIYNGTGFSHPFGYLTGPTAWCSPLLPSLFASLLWISDGSVRVVALFYLLLLSVALTFTFWTVFHIQSRYSGSRAAFFSTLIGIVIVLPPSFRWLIQYTHDGVLLLICMNLLYLGITKMESPPKKLQYKLCWGVFGGTMALASPILGASWALISLYRWYAKSVRSLLIVYTAAAVTISPWIIRNAVVFQQLIPIKSNGAFELYQSQNSTEAGLVDRRSLELHPSLHSSAEGKQYIELGEKRFLALKKQQFLAGLASNLQADIERAFNRLTAATFLFHEMDRNSSPFYGNLKTFLFVIPLFSLVLLAFGRKFGNFEELRQAAFIYGVFLTPYVLVSYYERYAIPLLPIKLTFVAFVLSGMLPRARHG